MKLQAMILCVAISLFGRFAFAENCKFSEINHHGQVTADCADKFIVLKLIGDRSNVKVVAGGEIKIGDRIDGGSNVVLRSETGSITIGNRIDGGSTVSLTSENGSITIGDRIDGRSKVKLSAPQGSITIGQRIDGNSQVCLSARGNITINDRIGRGDGRTEIWWEGSGIAVPHGYDGVIMHPHQLCPWTEPAAKSRAGGI